MAEIKVVELQIKTSLEGANNGISKLKTGLKEATKESKALGDTMQGSKQSEFINQLGDGISKLNPAFGGAVKGANGLLIKMWEIVANPIGAILAGIVITAKFLYEAFQSSVAGGKELKTIFAGISAIGEQVKDAMFGLGRALINVATAAYKFITLDFEGAAADMKKANNEATESYKQLGNAVDGTTFKIVRNLEKQQQANDKARKVQAVTQSETNKLLVQSREILTDETASIKDKKKALEEVTKAEIASSKEKERIALKDLQIAKVRAKAMGGEEEKKAKAELRELEIAYNEAQTENAMTGIKLNKQKKMLGRQEVSDAREAADNLKTINAEKIAKSKELYEADKTALTEKLREEGLNFQQRRDLIKADLLLTVKDRKKFNDEINKEEKKVIEEHNKAIADLNKKYDDEKLNRLADTAVKKEELDYQRQVKEIEKLAQTELEKQTLIEKLDGEHKVRLSNAIKTDADKVIADAKINADAQMLIDKKLADSKIQNLQRGSAMLGQISDLVGKNTAVGKTAAVASATIDTYAAAQSAFKNAQLNPISILGPAYPYISAGLAIAGGLKNVQSILAVKTPGGGGGSAPSGGMTGSAAPSFNVVGSSSTNQLAQTISSKEQQPFKAYVVANEVTTSQALNRNIIQSASIG